MPLPGQGTLSYNGVAFDSLHHSKLSIEPKYDDAERAVLYNKYTLEVSGWITDPGLLASTDGIMTTFRDKLNVPGGQLLYDEKGAGRIRVNSGSGTRDAAWGPKPQLLTYVPIGANLTAYVEWKCVFHIQERTALRRGAGLLSRNYDITWQINQDGFHVITQTGAIEIPLTWVADRTRVIDSADRYRDMINLPVREGFAREQNYRLSQDRRRLEFTYTDTEVRAPYPSTVTKCEVKHLVVQSEPTACPITWRGKFTGLIRVLPNQPREVALRSFMLVVASRFKKTRNYSWNPSASEANMLVVDPPLPPNQLAAGGIAAGIAETISGKRPTLIVDMFEAEEDIFGHDNRFSLSYTIINVPLRGIISATGLFEPIEGTSFSRWKRSLDSTDTNIGRAHKVRGNIGAFHNPLLDVIVDIYNQP